MSLTSYGTVPLAELESKRLLPDDGPSPPVALVVDDETIIADTVATILNNAGYAASAAYDAESALQMATLIPPDVAITDVVMPGMNGIEFAISLRKLVPDCRILLFSGQATTNDLLAQAGRAGKEFPVLAKPMHPTDLLQELANLFRSAA